MGRLSTLKSARLGAFVLGLALFATAGYAQTGRLKGKVVDASNKPVEGATVVMESKEMNRKLTTKTDRRGEFIQLLTESGMYRVTATDAKVGSASAETKVSLGRVAEMTIVLVPTTAANDAAKASYDELNSVYAKLSTDASVSSVMTAITQAAARHGV